MDDAAKALSQILRIPADDPAIQSEIAIIRSIHEHELESSAEAATYLDCFRPPILKRQLTGIAIQALTQLSGINFIFYYGTKFFQNSGISSGFTIQMIMSGIAVLSTPFGMYLIDTLGRRPLLLIGAYGVAVSQLIVAVSGTVSSGQTDTGEVFVTNIHGQRVAVALTCFFIFFFAATWGPLGWVITGDIFPLRNRAKSLSITTGTNWLFNWAIGFSTPYLVNYGKGYTNLQSKIFFVWFGACFASIFIVYFFVYETKGLTQEQVDQLYEEVSYAPRSSKWYPQPTIIETSDSVKKQVDLTHTEKA
jgi:MFS transporter, SP family, sugar:H+ symporter